MSSSPAARWAPTITQFEIPVLLAISPVLLFPAPGRLVVLAVVPVLLAAASISTGRAIPRTAMNVALSFLLAMVVVSLFVTIDIGVSLGKVCGVLLGALLFWAIARWVTNADRLQFATRVFLLAGVGLAAAGLFGANWDNKFAAVGAITSHIPAAIRGVPGAEVGFNTNAVGGCLILFVPLQVSLLMLGTDGWFPGAQRPWSSRSFWVVQLLLLTITAGTLILTESRTSWSALLAAVGIFLLWHSRSTRVLVAGVTVVVAGWILAVGYSPAYDFVVSRSGPALSQRSIYG